MFYFFLKLFETGQTSFESEIILTETAPSDGILIYLAEFTDTEVLKSAKRCNSLCNNRKLNTYFDRKANSQSGQKF